MLYRFAPSAVVRRLRIAGHAVARATSDPVELEAICLDLLRRKARDLQDAGEPSPPRFDQRTLGELASASRTVEWECPKHLVELVMNLASFERYSAECASHSPADLALHLELERAAGRARSIMEQALERVAIAEGFTLPAPPGGPVTAAVPVKTTPPAVRIEHTPDVITITDANTTIGYCRYEESGEIEYVFLNPAHRRKGDEHCCCKSSSSASAPPFASSRQSVRSAGSSSTSTKQSRLGGLGNGAVA